MGDRSARDGHEIITIEEANRLAQQAIKDLSGRNGDPSLAASWIRERRLAWIVYLLVSRIRNGNGPLELRRWERTDG